MFRLNEGAQNSKFSPQHQDQSLIGAVDRQDPAAEVRSRFASGRLGRRGGERFGVFVAALALLALAIRAVDLDRSPRP